MFFQRIREHFAIMGISEADLTENGHRLNAKIQFGLLILGINVILESAALFLYARGFQGYTESIYMTSIATVSFSVLLILIFKSKQLFELIDAIEKMVADSKTLDNDFPFIGIEIDKTVLRSEKWREWIYFIWVFVTTPCCLLPKPIVSLYFYYIKGFDGYDAFVLPLPMWLPFDWKNPMGYLVAVGLQYSVSTYIFFLLAGLSSLAIGTYLIGLTGTKEIRICIHEVNRSLHTEYDSAYIRRIFFNFILWHSKLKQQILDFTHLYQPMFVVIFTWCTMTISVSLMMIQMEIVHHENSLLLLLILVFQTSYSFGMVFLSCELCQSLSNQFDNMCYDMVQFDWYICPRDLKRILPMITHFTQQELIIECFGSISCNREAFKKVVNSAFSYFMTIRQFYN